MDEQEHKLEITKLRLEFWLKRLDHTHTHTETTSKLIYLVDAVVLGLLAFVVEKLKPRGVNELYLAPPVLFLALLNFYHANIIMRQREWYSVIVGKIIQILDDTNVSPVETKYGKIMKFLSCKISFGTHHIHSYVHWSAFLFLLFAGLGIVAHAFLTSP